MNRAIIPSLVLIILLLLPLSAHATTYTVGVKQGDWIRYGQFTVSYSGSGTAPAQVVEEKKIQWVTIEIEAVTGTSVTLNMTTHYNNGSEPIQTLTTDVAGSTIGPFFLIAANLTVGDRANSGTVGPIINETTTGTYAGATRTINIINVNTTAFQNQMLITRLVWDKATGLLLEAYVKVPAYETATPEETTPTAYEELSVKATETNIWTSNPLGSLFSNPAIIAGTAAIIITIAAVAVNAMRKPKPQPQSNQEPQSPPPTPQQPLNSGKISAENPTSFSSGSILFGSLLLSSSKPRACSYVQHKATTTTSS